MVQSMASVSQPRVIAGLVSGFGSFVRAHGFAVNLAAVVALGATGLGLQAGRPKLARAA